MKKFFLSKSKVNIFFVIGLILIISGFFYTKYPINLIGLLIAFIPETKNLIKHSIKYYKETGKINSYLIVQIVIFITTFYTIISIILGV